MNDLPIVQASGRLDGKVALLIGASRGIGAQTAKVIARSGAKVVLAARDEDALAAVVAEVQAAGYEARFMSVDVGDEQSVERLVQYTVDQFGRLDIAFNNATDGPSPKPLADMSVDEFDRAIRTNIRGTFLAMKFQVPAMLASGGGSIINMASVAGLQGVANLAGLCHRQSRHHSADQGCGVGLCGSRHPRERTRAGADPHPSPRGGGRAGATSSRHGHSDATPGQLRRSRQDSPVAGFR
jgi:NAD(P)-dependent dehydrogenase (short-subunit alcohol dehydrogenase family)